MTTEARFELSSSKTQNGKGYWQQQKPGMKPAFQRHSWVWNSQQLLVFEKYNVLSEFSE